MKSAGYQWEHPLLQGFKKTFSPSTVLFSQGEKGDSIYIVTQGAVGLVATEKAGTERLVGFLEAGDILGEQSLFNDKAYTRAFTARAVSEVSAIVISKKDLKEIQKRDASLMNDILRAMFRAAAERLKRANEVTHILRSSNNVERLIELILYFSRTSGQDAPKGKEFTLHTETIHHYIDMEPFQIEECFQILAKNKALIPQGGNVYILPNEERLREAIPSLQDHLPTIAVI